ncbi:hypothetical protein F5Y16DRAFT_62906 [Xylariaceae sp. FL0255]|nr:hypothetical protein F5Y16DRAFT_62906 [Xylariaceae sp. FL0255]
MLPPNTNHHQHSLQFPPRAHKQTTSSSLHIHTPLASTQHHHRHSSNRLSRLHSRANMSQQAHRRSLLGLQYPHPMTLTLTAAANTAAANTAAARQNAGTTSNRHYPGWGFCSECGKEVEKLNQHHKEYHFGNICQWPEDTGAGDGSTAPCGLQFYNEAELWDHLAAYHGAVTHHGKRHYCNWPGRENDYKNPRSAQRLARFAQFEALFPDPSATSGAGAAGST